MIFLFLSVIWYILNLVEVAALGSLDFILRPQGTPYNFFGFFL